MTGEPTTECYDAVCFDNDGILVDPPLWDSKDRAIRAAFDDVGVAEPERRHVEAMARGVTTDHLRTVCGHYGIDPEAFWSARERRDEDAQMADFRDDRREPYDDVDAIGEVTDGHAVAVVSNNHTSTVAFVLECFDLERYVDAAAGRPMTVESLDLKKPNPHYIERTLEDLGVTADAALYVGDSEKDVVAADRAGTDSAFVRRPHREGLKLSVEPTYEVETLEAVATLVG